MNWDPDEREEWYHTKVELLQKEIEELNSKVSLLNKALNVEVWDHKRAKFIPFRDTPEVVKVLNNGS